MADKRRAKPTSHTNLVPLQDVAEAAREFMGAARSPSTVRGYAADWRHFEAWCKAHDVAALPATPQVVALYLTAHVDVLKVSTLQRRLTAISQAHKMRSLEFDTQHVALRETWVGIKRTKGTAPTTKAPALTHDIVTMIAGMPDTLGGARDRALLLIGFAGAFRRSELVALEFDDLAFGAEGCAITLRRSKTDQEAEGRKIGIPNGASPLTCPVRALRTWLEFAGIDAGPVFRSVTRHGGINGSLSDKAVALIVKRAAGRAGLDPADYAGHSLRSGFATSAAAAGASERSIMQQTGHKSLPMVRRYIREGSLFRENAATKLGL